MKKFNVISFEYWTILFALFLLIIVYVQDVLKANKERRHYVFIKYHIFALENTDTWLCFNTLLSYCCYIGLTKIFSFSVIDFVSYFFCKFSLATFKSIFCNRHISTSFCVEFYIACEHSILKEEGISYNLTENIFGVNNIVLSVVFSLLLIIHNHIEQSER